MTLLFDDSPSGVEITQRAIYELTKRMTGQANTLTIPRFFIDLAGDHKSALMLSQIIYWWERTSDKENGFYKSAKEWEDELKLTPKDLRRIVPILERIGISTKVKKAPNGNPTVHYKVDEQRLAAAISAHLIEEMRSGDAGQNESEERAKSFWPKGQEPKVPKGKKVTTQRAGTLTETTPDTTTETTTTKSARPVHQSMPPAPPAHVVVVASMPTAPDPDPTPAAPPPVETIPVDAALVEELKAGGVTPDAVAVRLATDRPDRCRLWLDALKAMPTPPTNPGGWLTKNIQADYLPSKAGKPQESRRKAETRAFVKAVVADGMAAARRTSEDGAELTRIEADEPERFAAMRAAAVEAHPARLRSGLIFENAVRGRMLASLPGC